MKVEGIVNSAKKAFIKPVLSSAQKACNKTMTEIPKGYSDAIASIAKAQITSPQKIFKEIPYLYHITPVGNIKAIQKEGLRAFNIIDTQIPGIYFFDKANFLKHWTKTGDADTLMTSYIFRGEDLALLRVPISAFKTNLLKFRSYNECLDGKSGVHNFNQLLDYIKKGHTIEHIYSDVVPPKNIQVVGQYTPKIPENFDLKGTSKDIVKLLSNE